MKYPPSAGKFRLGPWPKGINNAEHPSELGRDELADIENFVLSAEGLAETRPGTALRVAATSAFGLHKVSEEVGVYFDDGKLYRLDVRTWEKTELASGYSSRLRVSWVNIGPFVFFTNGNEYGRIYVPTWAVLDGFGTPNPGNEVSLSALGYGSLHAGRYFVGITFVDSYGIESGCPGLNFVELTADGGIGVTINGAIPAVASSIRVYMTEANGDRKEMYRVLEVDASDTSFELTSTTFGSPIAELLFKDEIPVPDLITKYNGYLFFAIDNMVWHSETLNYGIYHIDHNEVGTYPQDVTVLEGGFDGIFVVADRTYAYVGDSPKEFALRDNVYNYPAAKFSGKQIEGKLFGMDGIPAEDVPFWFSSRGAVIGLPGGSVLPMMKGRAEPDSYGVGASGTVEYNGVQSVVTALDERNGPSDSFSLQDSFSVRVVNRGITED